MPKIKLQNIKTKLQEVYLPFLIVSIGTVFIYTFLRWLLDIRFGIIPLKQDLLDFWIPFALPWVPILIWMRRRIRILNVRGNNDNGYFLYQAVIAGTIFATLLNAQNYTTANSYGLNEIKSIEELDALKREKYFKVSSFLVEKELKTSYTTARTSGKYKDRLNITEFIALPFENSKTVWYGIEYKSSMSNHMSEAEKNRTYRKFLDSWEIQYKHHNFYGTRYFEKLGHSDELDGYVNAIQLRYPNLERVDLTILIPHKGEFLERSGNSLEWAFGSFAIGSFIFLIMVLVPKTNEDELERLKSGRPSKDDDLKDILSALNPIGEYKGTAILVWMNILAFVVMMFMGINIISPNGDELLAIGGNRKHEVLNGEYWRLLTSVFIHGGALHLLMNLMGLGLSGFILEQKLGSYKLISSFLACGLFASLSSIYFNNNVVSVGASGAIFGLFGVILAFTVFKVFDSQVRGFTWMILILYAGVNLVLGSMIRGIDNAAHFGGLISGFIIGYFLMLVYNKKSIDPK